MGWASAILSGVGAVNQISANTVQTKAEIAQALDNKKLANDAATDALVRGNADVAQLHTQAGEALGQQDVAYANSGVDATVGTAAAVKAASQAQEDLAQKTTENNAAREAWGFRRHGYQYGQQAQLEAAKGSARNAATFLNGAGQVINGVSSTYNSWNT